MPDVTPMLPSGDFSYSLEVIMGMQNALGKLEQTVVHLTEESKESRKKLERVCTTVYAATAVFSIFGGILIWIANTAVQIYLTKSK